MEKTLSACRRTWWSFGALVAAGLVVVMVWLGRDDATPPRTADEHPTTASNSASPDTQTDPPKQTDGAQRRSAARAGRRLLRAHLETWRREGLFVASRRYLEAVSQPPSDVGLPRLSSGRVLHADVFSWASPDRFTLEVSLDLHFRGDPMAWNDGRNDRFVTFTGVDGALRIADIATSP
jgi:hypothetical protein